MDYQQHLVRDFARRTRSNLLLLRRLQQENPNLEIYEVTQLVNSLLGLLVFPQQRYFRQIPHTPLEQLATEGWPIPRVVGEFPQAKDLHELVRYLRNAITHFNVQFLAASDGQLNGLRVWNRNPRSKKITWRADLSLSQIEELVERFITLILDEEIAQDV